MASKVATLPKLSCLSSCLLFAQVGGQQKLISGHLGAATGSDPLISWDQMLLSIFQGLEACDIINICDIRNLSFGQVPEPGNPCGFPNFSLTTGTLSLQVSELKTQGTGFNQSHVLSCWQWNSHWCTELTLHMSQFFPCSHKHPEKKGMRKITLPLW